MPRDSGLLSIAVSAYLATAEMLALTQRKAGGDRINGRVMFFGGLLVYAHLSQRRTAGAELAIEDIIRRI